MEPIKVELSDNRVLIMRADGKGRDLAEAQKRSAGSSEMIAPALISILSTVDGNPIFPDQVLDLPIGDYLAVLEAFNKAYGSVFS